MSFWNLDADDVGVYGIFRDNTAVYIGSGKLRDRLLAHFTGGDECIAGWQPNRWTALTYPAADIRRHEAALAREYQPKCGERYPQV